MERKLRKSKHWWRVPLLLLMCLIGSISPTWASSDFSTSSYTKVISSPSLADPYYRVRILFYDADSWDSFFCHNKTEGNNKGPAVYVDGHYICSPDSELAWPDDPDDDDGSGNGKGCWEACNSNDGWWGSGYSKTINGITYTIKFWDPKCTDNSDKTSGKRYVDMFVFINKLQVGAEHSIRVRGRWKTNNDGVWWKEVTFSTNASDSRLKLNPLGTLGMGSPSAEMSGYQKMKISGNLKSDYGPTTVGTYNGATTSSLGWTDNLTTYGTYNKGLGKFTDLELGFEERTDYWGSQSKYIEYVISDQMSFGNATMPEVKLYQWYIVTATGFVRAKNLIYSPDIWNKRITISWAIDGSDTRSTAGTWSIYRGTTLLKSGLGNSETSYTDESVPDYETNYTYNVVFVPTGSPSGTTRSELTTQTTAKLTRPTTFFSNLKASDNYDDKIVFSWSHLAVKSASGSNRINLTVERSTDRQNWTTAKTIAIEDSTTTSGSFEDKQDLETFVTYYYRLHINVMGKTYESEPVTGQLEGMSKVTEFTASRGTYSSMVKLKWLVKQVGTTETYFTIYRRPLGSADEKDWGEIYSTNGTAASYSYDDVTALPGSFNEYKVAVSMMNGQQLVPGTETTVDGFSVATGVVSGRVTYGTGTAVSDAKVTLKQQSSDGTLASGMRALLFNSSGAGLCYQTDTTTIHELFSGDFSVQMYLYPVFEAMAANNTRYITFDSYNVFSLYLRTDAANKRFEIQPWVQGYKSSGVYIPGNEWSHVTVVYKSAIDSLRVIVHKADETTAKNISAGFAWSDTGRKSTSIAVANNSGMNFNANFRGYVDEVRFFTKALTDTEIDHNYNHPLAGNESGLAIYYPLDEGIVSQMLAYDFSKSNGLGNGRHARANVPATSTDQIPSEDQLSLMAYTDSIGNYTVRGVPFANEGTSYTIIPSLGIHEFSPSAQSRFVSMSSLNHSAVDFTDVSSFPVSGKVFYANTTYPVEGVSFYVDGSICSKDGEIIQTDENGDYTISVPIGYHFITTSMNGHVFADNGRYPADPNNTGKREEFKGEVKNLTFYDETLVNFTGRVVGGDIEGKKAVGFGLSKNNIGETEMVLTPTNDLYVMNSVRIAEETVVRDSLNAGALPIASATDLIASTSWRKGGTTKADCQKLIIRTDPQTGEFSAMLPPLQYKIESIRLVKNGDKVGDPSTIDLTNPHITYSDTLYADDGESYELYEYNTCLRQTYHSDPTFTVVQEGREDGSFGIDKFTISDDLGDTVIDDIYSVAGGTVTYNYGTEGNHAPLFKQDDPYTFLIEGYEEYVNVDNGEADHVPLAGNVVTINNALSSEQSVYVSSEDGHTAGEVVDMKGNQLTLDSQGRATYIWRAGFPNIAEPFTRTITMDYDINGRLYSWKNGSDTGIKGIVLGDLPTGNNFVTAGPDHPTMILRDPPGTNSFTEWTSGSSYTHSTVGGNTVTQNTAAAFKHKFGFGKAIVAGSIALGTVTSIEQANDLEVGAKMESEYENSTTMKTTTSTTKTISTSAAPEYVGAQGDVFIGNSTNIIFGKSRYVGFQRTSPTTAKIGMEDIIKTGLQFGTMFMYTQNYIENVLLPNYEMLRKSYLKTTIQDSIDNYVNNTGHTVYLTTLKPTDEKFGSSGTYVVKKATTEAEDSVLWINTQIENWQNVLMENERTKVEVYKFGKILPLQSNISFDSGTTYNYTYESETDSTHTTEWKVAAGIYVDDLFGLKVDNFGFEIHITDETMGGRHESDEDEYVDKASFSFTLAEDGDDDALTVDVYPGLDGFSPVFRTRGGQTSCPYEDKVVTKYYEPGTIIQEATMQIEVPQINVDVPIMNDVPTGTSANYTLRLSNASEIDEDVYYRLLVADETNPDGAALSIDGKAVTDSRVIKIPAGTTITKALQLMQTNTSILDYDSIAVVLASQCQYDPTSTWDVITDTVYISAHFVPSSSAVDLALSNTTINTETGTDLDLTFSGFDRNYRGLKAFRLQYKKQGSADWTLLHEYVLDKDAVTENENNELLPTNGAKVTYKLPMKNFSDGEYLFRCVSASTYGNSEVYRYSDEIALVKDMQRPTPLGLPEPADGILSAGDDISITFNETFLKGELTKEQNFLVTGVLNGAEVAHETALSMQDTETAAQTEASITLAGKDFSADMWVNIDGAGTILSHGSGASKMTIGTNANSQLVVTLGNNTYTSNASVPTAKWVFLTLSYAKADAGGNLSASVASDDKTITLFNGISVAAYEGAGPIAVGKNLSGAIHELLLWDEAHDLPTALLNRSKTKNPSTRHLIGYWKMDEGEGTSIRDYARNRHMKMSAETWYLNNVNKAVALSGSNYLTVPTADLGIFSDDDYAVEFWMRSDKQTAETQLLQMGDVALWMNAAGQLQLTGKQAYNDADATVLATNSPSLTDNAWHHVALNVLRQGAAAVYVDGQRVLTTNASNVGTIASDRLLMGVRRTTFTTGIDYSYDRLFKGQIDEIRIWGATLNAEKLSSDRKVRLAGKESGLMAYFPFEKKGLDGNNQPITLSIPDDLTGSGKVAQLVTPNTEPTTLNYTDEAPALRTKPTETNVSFTYVASDTKIVINIDEEPAAIEGTTLHFTVHDLSDVNGNYSLPTVWSAFVNQKRLVWDTDELTVEQPANSETTVTATIKNNGGTMQSWTLNGIPSWMRASVTSGDTNPLSETKITFTVTESTAIGKYEETIYLTGTDGIEVPLTIRVTVKGKEPDWAVNENDFEGSMILIGTLEILGVPSEDSDDIVAAFVDGECRGLARPEYMQRYDRNLLSMDIYGNNDELNKDVTFKAYDASTGVTYPVIVTSEDVNFQVDEMYGKPANPVILSAVDIQEQLTALAKGWNWLSLNVTLDEMTVPVVFKDISASTALVKNKKISMMNYDGTWYGQSIGLNNSEMYKVQMSQADNLHIMGKKVDPQATPITLVAGWNWVAYNGSQTISITDAMADMDPRDGDVVKGQRGTAMYDGYEWFGGLKSLVPGQGYMIKTTDARTFRYPKAVSTAGARMMNSYDEAPSHFTPVDCHLYPSNMTVVAQVLVSGVPAAGIEVGVFDKEECRAAAVTDADGLAMLTIPGDGHATMTFRVYDGSQTAACNETLLYENDAIQGSRRSPFVVSVSATGIETLTQQDSDSMLYDLQGRRVYRQTEGVQRSTLKKGVYIEDGQKRVKK